MDVLVCNGLGIYCGMKTLKWLSLKTYKWQGLWNIPTYKYVSAWGPGTCGAAGDPRSRPCSFWCLFRRGVGATDEDFPSWNLHLELVPGLP